MLLPVKSLCRFRCVSKLWLSVISDPNFVAAHLERSKSRPKLLISVRRGANKYVSGCDEMILYSIDYPDEKAHLESSPSRLLVTAHGSINNPIRKNPIGGDVSASGRICCSCLEGIRIGNPVTGEFKLIQYPVGCDISCAESYLGFDLIDQTPVILLLQSLFCGKSSIFPLLENQWHHTPSQPIMSLDEDSVVCIDGLVYFSVWVYLSSSEKIETCLYASEVRFKCFERIQDPPDPKFWVERVIEYKGRVALFGSEYSNAHKIKLWILEDPSKRSWRFKSFVIPWIWNDLTRKCQNKAL